MFKDKIRDIWHSCAKLLYTSRVDLSFIVKRAISAVIVSFFEIYIFIFFFAICLLSSPEIPVEFLSNIRKHVFACVCITTCVAEPYVVSFIRQNKRLKRTSKQQVIFGNIFIKVNMNSRIEKIKNYNLRSLRDFILF